MDAGQPSTGPPPGHAAIQLATAAAADAKTAAASIPGQLNPGSTCPRAQRRSARLSQRQHEPRAKPCLDTCARVQSQSASVVEQAAEAAQHAEQCAKKALAEQAEGDTQELEGVVSSLKTENVSQNSADDTPARARRRQGYDTYVWPATKDRYVGWWVMDRMHGFGVFKWANGDVYEGQWEYGKMCGKGRKTMANGDVYDGEWRDDKAHGYGVKMFANGDRHEGLYLNDKREGDGVYRWVNGDVYKGQWKDGKMCGKGIKYMSNGDVYKGQWLQDKAHGLGVKEFQCGDVHVGNYKLDKREGFGTYTWSNGDRYQGLWKDGRMNGRGVKTMANGDVYDGEWQDDKAHGYGTKSFACGDRHVGEYREDRRHGYGVYEWANNDKYEGWWIRAEQSGNGTYYYANGDVFQGRWLQGKKHGKGIFTSASNNCSYTEMWETGMRRSRERTHFTPSRMLRTLKPQGVEAEETALLRAEIERLKAVLEKSPAILAVPFSSEQLASVQPLDLLQQAEGAQPVQLPQQGLNGERSASFTSPDGKPSTIDSNNAPLGENGGLISSQNQTVIVLQRSDSITSAGGDGEQDEAHREAWKQLVAQAVHGPKPDMCKICYERSVNVVLIRCGHMCSCLECSQQIERCPICRQRIVDVVRTYRV